MKNNQNRANNWLKIIDNWKKKNHKCWRKIKMTKILENHQKIIKNMKNYQHQSRNDSR